MKATVLILSVFILFSCSETARVNTEVIWGTWHDVHTYEGEVISGGITDTVSYPNILYHFYENGTYKVENEVPWGLPSDGVCQYDEGSKVLRMIPDTPDEELGLNRTFAFEVLSVSESKLEVMYKYWSAPLEEGSDTIKFAFYRQFERK